MAKRAPSQSISATALTSALWKEQQGGEQCLQIIFLR